MFYILSVMVYLYNFIYLYICGDVHLYYIKMHTVYCIQICNCVHLSKHQTTQFKKGVLLYVNYASVNLILKKSNLRFFNL